MSKKPQIAKRRDGLFVSYRRSDSADVTGRICDFLRLRTSSEVFKDVDSIPLGTAFRERIEMALDNAAGVLVVIGPNWLTAEDAAGTRRLDHVRDHVRLEIEAALRSEARVIPVLVGGAQMPEESQLPDSIAHLAQLAGQEVRSDPDFHKDILRVVGGFNGLIHFEKEDVRIIKLREMIITKLERLETALMWFRLTVIFTWILAIGMTLLFYYDHFIWGLVSILVVMIFVIVQIMFIAGRQESIRDLTEDLRKKI